MGHSEDRLATEVLTDRTEPSACGTDHDDRLQTRPSRGPEAARPIASMFLGKDSSGAVGLYRSAYSKMCSLLTASRNTCHDRAGYCCRPPPGFMESRTAICPFTGATSTQAPLPALRLALRHWRSRASKSVGDIGLPDLCVSLRLNDIYRQFPQFLRKLPARPNRESRIS